MTPSDADTPLTAEEEALDRLRQRMIRDLTSFLLSARLVSDYEHARAHAESLYLSRHPDLARVYADAARSSPAPADGLREALDRLVVAALPTLGTTNPDIRAAYKALNDSPPTGPCPRCGRPDAARSCPDCYSEFAALCAANPTPEPAGDEAATHERHLSSRSWSCEGAALAGDEAQRLADHGIVAYKAGRAAGIAEVVDAQGGQTFTPDQIAALPGEALRTALTRLDAILNDELVTFEDPSDGSRSILTAENYRLLEEAQDIAAAPLGYQGDDRP